MAHSLVIVFSWKAAFQTRTLLLLLIVISGVGLAQLEEFFVFIALCNRAEARNARGIP